jgi:hypothetical protein
MELAAAIACPVNVEPALLSRSAAQGDPVSRTDLDDFLRRAWPRLAAWWRWFDRLQSGPVPGSYRCVLCTYTEAVHSCAARSMTDVQQAAIDA